MFQPPQIIETEVFARLPDQLRKSEARPPVPGYVSWLEHRGQGFLDCFLEGPAFDREGRFYCVDLAHGRIMRVDPSGNWDVFAEYDGDPNGLKIHRDGRIYVADRRFGVVVFDPVTGERSILDFYGATDRFAGLNDLYFDENGDLFLTDQGLSGIGNPTGRVFRLNTEGRCDLVADGLEAPNGIVAGPGAQTVFISVTRTNRVMTVPPPSAEGRPSPRLSIYLQLSGGRVGPDGMAMDAEGNLYVAHSGMGSVWVFSPLGEPIYRIVSCAGTRTTNLAFGGDDLRSVYITESETGVILQARAPAPGARPFALS